MILSTKEKYKDDESNNSHNMNKKEDIGFEFFNKRAMSYNQGDNIINSNLKLNECHSTSRKKYISKNLSNMRHSIKKKFNARRPKKSISARTTKNRVISLIFSNKNEIKNLTVINIGK